MSILSEFYKSLKNESEEVLPLAKALSESEASLSSLLDQIDGVSTLSKSAMAEVSAIESEEAVSQKPLKVLTGESKLPASKTNTNKKGKTMEEEADIEMEEAKEQPAVTVLGSETKMGAEAKKGKMAEVMLRKADKMEEETETPEEEEEEHEGKNPKEALDEKTPFAKKGEENEDEDEDMMKSFGLSASDLDLIDATVPLANLKKGFDIQSDEIRALKKSVQSYADLFKSLAETTVKSFALQKSIAAHLDNLASKPHQVKGQSTMLQKNFDVSDDSGEVSVGDVSNSLMKSITSGRMSGNDMNIATSAIATLETAGLTNSVMNAYNRFK